MSGIAIVLPWVLGVVAFAIVSEISPQFIDNEMTQKIVNYGATIALGFFSIILFMPGILGAGVFRCMAVFILTSIVVVGLLYVAGYALEAFGKGKSNFTQAPSLKVDKITQ